MHEESFAETDTRVLASKPDYNVDEFVRHSPACQLANSLIVNPSGAQLRPQEILPVYRGILPIRKRPPP